MVPLIFFTDDTSGNSTKKWNCYDSYIMTCAAMPLSEQNKYENNLFILTDNRLTAMDVIPALTTDIIKLEQKGVPMFDVSLGENVLVFGKVLFISGDNVRLAKLALNKGSKSDFPCRRCYSQVDGRLKKGEVETVEPLCWQHHLAAHRKKEHLDAFLLDVTHSKLADQDAIHVLNRNRPKATKEKHFALTKLEELGCKNTNAGALLKLKSLDIVKDTPVEALHTLLLGVAKYCSVTAFKYFFKDPQMKELTRLCREYKSKAYSRNLYSSLNYHKSFLGRDYKILCQVLPIILDEAYRTSKVFAHFRVEGSLEHQQYANVFKVFDSLGDLVSLVYMERIESNFTVYKQEVRKAAQATLDALSVLTYTPVSKDDKKMKTNLVNRLKTHLLVHLDEDLNRFATTIHTETEKGEQFNKEIHDALRHTNRDDAVIFGEKYIYRHLAYDGAYS